MIISNYQVVVHKFEHFLSIIDFAVPNNNCNECRLSGIVNRMLKYILL
jgi:hypothetical protein